MDSIALGTLAGSVTSLFFSYFPGLSTWFSGLESDKKSLFNLVVLALVTIGAYVSNCYGIYQLGLVCDQQGLVDLIKLFVATVVGSQSTWLATRRL